MVGVETAFITSLLPDHPWSMNLRTVPVKYTDLNLIGTVLTRMQPSSCPFLSTFGVVLLPQYVTYSLFFSGSYQVSKEATPRPIREQLPQASAYEVVETVQTIADTMQLLTTTRTTQIALVTITLHFEHEGKITPARSS